MGSASYSMNNLDIRKIFFAIDAETDKIKYVDEIIQQLKEKYSRPDTTRYEKLQLLTVLPGSWTVQKIMVTFGACRYTAIQAKELLVEKGPLISGRRIRTSINPNDELVKQFYEDDETSRVMPGKKDCVTIRKGGKRQSVQKRSMMSTLRE